jgi:N-acetylmuramoyl-L-alanine amidase
LYVDDPSKRSWAKKAEQGAYVGNRSEVDFVYRFCQVLQSKLQEAGIGYRNVKSADAAYSVTEKWQASNAYGSELKSQGKKLSLNLSIHADSNTGGYTGVKLFYMDAVKDKDGNITKKDFSLSKQRAESFAEKIRALGIEVRVEGEYEGTAVHFLQELHYTDAPAVYMEIGSIDTAASASVMNQNRDKLAKGVVDAIQAVE